MHVPGWCRQYFLGPPFQSLYTGSDIARFVPWVPFIPLLGSSKCFYSLSQGASTQALMALCSTLASTLGKFSMVILFTICCTDRRSSSSNPFATRIRESICWRTVAVGLNDHLGNFSAVIQRRHSVPGHSALTVS